jgi:hypothetical protein
MIGGSALAFLSAETDNSEARKIGLIGGIGMPVMTGLAMMNLIPGPFEGVYLGFTISIGYIGLVLMGPLMLAGLLVGFGFLTAGLTRELIVEYA